MNIISNITNIIKILFDDVKMVIIVRNDLNMSKGKIAAQVGHTVISTYQKSLKMDNKYLKKWETFGQKKIVLKVESKEEIIKIYNQFKEKNIPCSIIRDAGRTEIEPNTITVCSAGPWNSKEIDEVTGKLSLLH